MIEIELKARLHDSQRERIERELTRLCGAPTPIDKEDIYLALPNDAARGHIRIRKTAEGCYCTIKKHRTEDNVEHNIEEEFRVESYERCYAALRLFGFSVDARKRKVGNAYCYQDTLIEVIEVVGIGNFIELEQIVSPREGTPARRESIHNTLLHLLDELHLPRDAIEGRRYIDLLRARDCDARTDALDSGQ